MKATTLLLCILLLGASRAAAAQLEPGAAVPEFEATEWFNHPPLDLDSLQGRVVALLMLRIENTDCLFYLETWEELRRDYALEPVTFLAVTNESPAYVKENIELEDIRAPIVIDAEDKAAPAFGVQVFPSVFVQGPDGRVVFAGAPGNLQEIKDAITFALRAAAPWPELPKKMRAVTKHLAAHELGKAYAAIVKELEKPKLEANERQLLQDTRALLEETTRKLATAAAVWLEEEDWPRGVTALWRLAEEHQGIPGAEAVAERLAALVADTALGDEIRAAVEYAEGERAAREGDWRQAHRKYESLARLYPSTKAGQAAVGLAERAAARAKR